jgi:hypothetical protein
MLAHIIATHTCPLAPSLTFMPLHSAQTRPCARAAAFSSVSDTFPWSLIYTNPPLPVCSPSPLHTPGWAALLSQHSDRLTLTALHHNMVLASDIVDLASLSSAQTSLPPPPIPQPCHSTSPESFPISLLCSSVNDHIPAEWAALKYSTVDQAIALVAAQGPGAILIKRDLQDAFCHMPRYCPSGPLTTGFFAGKDPIGWNASYPSACGPLLITLTFSPKRCIGFLILRHPRSLTSFTTLTTFSKYHRQKQRCRLTADMKADLRWWQRFLPC